VPDLVVLTLHPLPESPPAEDREDRVLFIWEDGHTETHPADSWTPDWFAEEPVAWAERLVLPAPGDRLTSEDVEELMEAILDGVTCYPPEGRAEMAPRVARFSTATGVAAEIKP
jgi:hypothetical protein